MTGNFAALEEWLVREALSSPHIPEMFAGMCQRMRRSGIPVDRAMLSWATLHPLFEAETIWWNSMGGLEHVQHRHDAVDTEAWLNSPIKAMLDSGDPRMRRRLSGANAEFDYPLLVELRDDGYTDYLIVATHFHIPAVPDFTDRTGILVSWATRTEGGFGDEAVEAIDHLQTRLALACQGNILARITRTIADTYLGPRAAGRVLSGQIRHGDGETIDAVIFYCDLRGSTALAEEFGSDGYLKHLNAYFAATAGVVAEHGGEILDFIGDAVLAVFPTDPGGLEEAARRALEAVAAVRVRLASSEPPLHCGMALSAGKVMFGNIGIADRLTFSVIGQTVNAAARIEALTKALGCPVLVTAEIAATAPGEFSPAGRFALDGFGEAVELFCPLEDAALVEGAAGA